MKGQQLRRALFWEDLHGDPLANAAAQVVTFLFGGARGRQPQHYIRTDVPRADRFELAEILFRGKVLMGYMGFAECRICRQRLGTRDLGDYGFMWPERAEHYVLEHNVWTPECDDILAAARSAR